MRDAADARACDEAPEHAAAMERLRTVMTPDAIESDWAAGRAHTQTGAVALATTG
jgi:hypothetical protein